MDITLSLEWMKRWGIKGGWGILDQGIFSGANFLLTIFLAQRLRNEDFGAFAVGLAVLTFLMQVYTSFALEPIGVLGPSNYKDRLASYLQAQARLLFILAVPIGFLLALLVWVDQVFGSASAAAPVLIFSAINLPFILFPLLMRRAFYVLLKPGIALLGSVIYFLVLIVSFSLLTWFSVLNGLSSLLIISVAGFLSGLVLLVFLRNRHGIQTKINLKAILLEMWSFGKWLILSGTLIGLATQSQIYLTGVLSRIEDAGAIRILQTLIQPMMLTSTAFSALATPAITADFAANSYQSMRNKIIRFTLVLGGIAIVYEVLLVVFGSLLNQTLFDGKYVTFTEQIPVWGLIPVLLSFFLGGFIALQASQNPEAIVIISAVWALFSFVPGLIIIPAWGAWGATISIVGGFIAALISTWILYWKWVHQIYFNVKRSVE